jgi:hypothetical protein
MEPKGCGGFCRRIEDNPTQRRQHGTLVVEVPATRTVLARKCFGGHLPGVSCLVNQVLGVEISSWVPWVDTMSPLGGDA